jgi:para-nitrobenzyl esterase
VKQGEPAGAEDCLYLNVWAPSFAAGEVPSGGARLPVMVWIHGGGNSVGHGGFYDGSNLASTENVLVLTANYRLGPLGWFRHAALRGEGTTAAERSGNFTTLDLVRVLEWVRENAAAFGGDPDNVTIFGESAGGTNVVTLLVSPLREASSIAPSSRAPACRRPASRTPSTSPTMSPRVIATAPTSSSSRCC